MVWLLRVQATLALASTEALLQRVPMFADDRPLLEAVAVLLKPAYALAGARHCLVVWQGMPGVTQYCSLTKPWQGHSLQDQGSQACVQRRAGSQHPSACSECHLA